MHAVDGCRLVDNNKSRRKSMREWTDGGGMGVRDDEPMVESDCIRCVSCGHEFDARLEMMES